MGGSPIWFRRRHHAHALVIANRISGYIITVYTANKYQFVSFPAAALIPVV